MNHRRYELELPTFGQTKAIIYDVIQENPTEDFGSRLEAIKLRHLALGFRYPIEQIHRAMTAIAHVTSAAAVYHANRPGNPHSARST